MGTIRMNTDVTLMGNGCVGVGVVFRDWEDKIVAVEVKWCMARSGASFAEAMALK